MSRPPFDSLPLRKGDPPFSAWGLYGMNDNLGTLNLLTPEIIASAGCEIRSGARVGLDLPLNFLLRPSHKRQKLKHTIIWKEPRPVHDDLIDMNTQISTQWDGYRHYGYSDPIRFYNDTTVDDINGPNSSANIGIHAWCEKGIIGRGVLLDYLRWCEAEGRSYDLMSAHGIKASDLKACANSQGITLKQGDVLLIRSGFVRGYSALSDDAKLAWSEAAPTQWVGVEPSIDMIQWLWENGVVAVAGDAPGFEKVPFGGVLDVGSQKKLSLHEILLAGWGMPIGEMFDLERLAEECVSQKRWSFFFSSMPLNLEGGVASPANCVALF